MRSQESCVSCRTEAELKQKRKSDKAKVLAYKHKELVKRLSRKLDIPPAEAEILFQKLLNFLWKCGTTKKSCRPLSGQVDEAWHHFILFTKDYAEFCYAHFGHFIHHQPDPEKEISSKRNSTPCRSRCHNTSR